VNPSIHGTVGHTSGVSYLLDGNVGRVQLSNQCREALIGNCRGVGIRESGAILSGNWSKIGNSCSVTGRDTGVLGLFMRVGAVLWEWDGAVSCSLELWYGVDPEADSGAGLVDGGSDSGECPPNLVKSACPELERCAFEGEQKILFIFGEGLVSG
jgi:hypothetical protein